MTAPTSAGSTGTSGSNEAEIIDFLRANPAFLDKHPELLQELTIPHSSGHAVSLLERQIALVRDENARVKQQINELIKLARENETLNHKIHDLAYTLMNAVGPQAIFSNLERCLADDFAADRVFSFVFADPAFVDSGEVTEFVGGAATARGAFAGVIEAARTVCGPLSAEQRLVLFDDEDHRGSAVVMPLNGKGWDGVLVVSSEEVDHYEADMGTEFLTYLSDVVTLVLDPWVQRPKPD